MKLDPKSEDAAMCSSRHIEVLLVIEDVGKEHIFSFEGPCVADTTDRAKTTLGDECGV